MSGCLPDLQAVTPKLDLVSMADINIRLCSWRLWDDWLAARNEFLEEACTGDVVCVDVGVDAVLEVEAEVLDGVRVPLRQLHHGVDQNGLPGPSVGKQVGVSARGPVKKLPE